jgi:hypothetical protein
MQDLQRVLLGPRSRPALCPPPSPPGLRAPLRSERPALPESLPTHAYSCSKLVAGQLCDHAVPCLPQPGEVVQLRSWGCLLEEGAPTGPKLKVRCLSRVTGLMPTMSSPFHLNPPSDLGKRPACSMPVRRSEQ